MDVSREHGLREALTAAAANGAPFEIEAALGRHKHASPADTKAAATAAAGAALAAARWENLAYLATFLQDVTAAHGGRDSDSDGEPGDDGDGEPGDGGDGEPADDGDSEPADAPAGRPACACTSLSIPAEVLNANIFKCVVSVTGKDPRTTAPSDLEAAQLAEVASCLNTNIFALAVERPTGPKIDSVVGGQPTGEMADTATNPAADGSVVSFEVDDPYLEPGEGPSPYISLEDPEDSIAHLRGAADIVIPRPAIRARYRYPLDTRGPSPLEQREGGWIFEERAPDGAHFTRADLARAVAERYAAIYADEAATAAAPATRVPGMLNRAQTSGRYGIWGHDLGDLMLVTVEHNPEHDLYELSIDS
jgi:hypothetical protein